MARTLPNFAWLGYLEGNPMILTIKDSVGDGRIKEAYLAYGLMNQVPTYFTVTTDSTFKYADTSNPNTAVNFNVTANAPGLRYDLTLLSNDREYQELRGKLSVGGSIYDLTMIRTTP